MLTPPRVVVIGSGLAGLRCADVLVQSGAFEVTVIEASDRIGGRVLTKRRKDGGVIEAGAQWIHGTQGNPLMHEDEESSSPPHKKRGGRRVIARITGEPVDAIVFEKAWRWTSREISNCGDSRGGGGESIGEIVRSKMESDDPIFVACCEHRLRWERTISAGDADDLDADSWGEYFERGGPDLRVRKGYDFSTKALASSALGTSRPATFRLGTRAKKVTAGKRMSVDGEDFDHVVVTASLGALKRNSITFEPALDSLTASAIERLGFGCVEKIFIEFDNEWWSDLGLSGEWHVVTFDEDEKDPVFGDSVISWRHDPFIQGKPTVVGWVAGEDALARARRASDDEVLQSALRILARLSGIDKCEEGRLLLRTTWADEPHYGSYSFVKVGATGEDVDALARVSSRCPGLSLAGEHTHRTRYSTADGAYLSGERAAVDVLVENVLPPFSCVLVQNARGDFLAEVRSSSAEVGANQLTCFGGKRELGETALGCAAREFGEELGLDLVSSFPVVEPATYLVVNGILIACFFKAANSHPELLDTLLDSVRLEDGANGAEWAKIDDSRWTPWHRAVLEAYRDNKRYAFFDDGNPDATLNILRRLPTAVDYAHVVSALAR